MQCAQAKHSATSVYCVLGASMRDLRSISSSTVAQALKRCFERTCGICLCAISIGQPLE